MPYISQSGRELLELEISALVAKLDQVVGVNDPSGTLNYTVTSVLLRYANLRYRTFRYFVSPLLRGVLADVSSEIYRRVVGPYEGKQIERNGDLDVIKELAK